MLQQGMESIAGVAPAEADAFADYAARCRKSFSRKALPLLDNAMMLIERNINLKILFCDLVDRLYILI